MNVHEAIRQSPDGPFISSYKYAGRRAGCHLDLEAVDGPDGDGQISEVTAALICHWYNLGPKLLERSKKQEELLRVALDLLSRIDSAPRNGPSDLMDEAFQFVVKMNCHVKDVGRVEQFEEVDVS